MILARIPAIVAGVSIIIGGAMTAHAADAPELPAPFPGRVEFDKDIKPILQAHCVKCHARGKYKGGLSLESRQAVLRGGEGGPAVAVGKSGESLLVELVGGLEPERRMPERGKPLSSEQVAKLRAWIDQGLAWPEEFSFGFRKATLAGRTPEVPPAPAGSGIDQPVDRFLAAYFAQSGVTVDWVSVADRTFARRAYLDLNGLLPTAEQLAAFEKDARADKADRLVAALLADRRAYADHWLTFWNDALRNAYRGTGFIDGGRKTITQWLYRELYENRPYDQFVRDLISSEPGSEGFTKGIVWRGVVNASQAPPVQAAQNVSQVFLGTNLKCASCHDSFVNYWKLSDAYALASVFAEKPLEIHRCDKPTGKTSSIGFVYPELGRIDAKASRQERLKQLAEILVKPEDGRFARTIVNRLWAHLMGHGIVEPLDDMDQVPWSQDLLDWLASDLVAHRYDLKHTVATICTSRAYRMKSVGVAGPAEKGPYRFRGPLTKRMSAEQFSDAVSAVTGVWPQAAGDMLKVDGRGQGGQVADVRAAIAAASGDRPTGPRVDARWIWSHPDATRDPGGRILVRKSFHVDKRAGRVRVIATCDNELVLFVNGHEVGRSAEWSRPVVVDVTKLIHVGENVIAAEATNWPDAEHGRGTQVQGANPAAFIAWVGGFEQDRLAWALGTDSSWLWSKDARKNWQDRNYETTGWKHAAELPNAGSIYGGSVDLTALVRQSLTTDDATPVRAALTFDDPLLSALGRTSREQVVTRRDPIATTLQALELANGVTLDSRLQKGARLQLDKYGRDGETIVRGLYLAALNRPPAGEEGRVARELLGTPATAEGVQDLLWALFMLPEFQLIQ